MRIRDAGAADLEALGLGSKDECIIALRMMRRERCVTFNDKAVVVRAGCIC